MRLTKSYFRLLLMLPLVLFLSEINAQDSVGVRQGMKTKNWVLPACAGLAYLAATYSCYRFFDSEIQKASQNNRSHFLNSISTGVTHLGQGKYHSIALAGTAVYAFAAKNKRLKKTVFAWAASLFVNSTLTDQLKKTFQRHRPNSGDPFNLFDWRHGPKINVSFPSGHTSNAFTTATVFASLYKKERWVAPVAYGLASLVGLSRIYDNAHWTSDVLGGAAIGFISAKAAIWLYDKVSRKVLFLPQVSNKFGGIMMVCQL